MNEEAKKESPEKELTDLQKYEKEYGLIQQRMIKLNEERDKLVQHGTRIEGIILFLREKEKEAVVPEAEPKQHAEKDAKAAPEVVAE